MAWSRPWVDVIEVLKHEMAHQYVHEILGIRDETAHGPAFQRICEKHGIQPEASERSPESPEQVKALHQIRQLLALAESSERHEAEQAMKAAHRRMLKYNLHDLPRSPDWHVAQVGTATARVDPYRKILAGILTKHFFVRAIWISAYLPDRGLWGRALEVAGTAANVELANYTHAFLLHTGEQLWAAYKRHRKILSNAERRRFLAGVYTGFAEKLDLGTQECKDEGLIWLGDPRLEELIHRRHPRLRKFGARISMTSAWQDGKTEGKKIVLRKGVSEATGGRGKLLKG